MAETTESPKSSEVTTNKPLAPKTLPDFYKQQYEIQFKKLPKPEQELLLANLSKPAPTIRGVQREWPNVRAFVCGVIEKAELEFEKAQVKAAEVVKATK